MARPRDYRAEYARRIASAERRGLSRSQARGHARHGELSAQPRPPVASDDRLETGLRLLHRSGNLSRAAKDTGLSTERLRRFAREIASAEWRGRKWHLADHRLRDAPIYSGGKQITLRVVGHDPASLAGKYMAAAGEFLSEHDTDLLSPFQGVSITDEKRKSYPLETDPNGIYQADAAGEPAFHEIYRIIQSEN